MLQTQLYEKICALKTAQATQTTTGPIPYSTMVVDMLRHGNNGKVISIVSLAVDFYLTILMRDVLAKRATFEDGFDPMTSQPCFIFTDTKYMDWSMLLRKTITDNQQWLDAFMYTYICAACAGELRHAPSKIKKWDKATNTHRDALNSFGITQTYVANLPRSETQKRFLNTINAAMSVDFLRVAVEVFGNYGWGGSFGGKAWASVARCALERTEGKLDAVSFIDRAFDLKHNGGPIFDKNKIVSQYKIQEFLNDKYSAKKDSDWNPWLQYCSAEVHACLAQAKTLGLWSGNMATPAKTDSYKVSYDFHVKIPLSKIASVDEEADEDIKPAVPVLKFPLADVSPVCPTGAHK